MQISTINSRKNYTCKKRIKHQTDILYHYYYYSLLTPDFNGRWCIFIAHKTVKWCCRDKKEGMHLGSIYTYFYDCTYNLQQWTYSEIIYGLDEILNYLGWLACVHT